MGLVVFALTIGGVLLVEYILAFIFRPEFTLHDYFLTTLFSILPYCGLAIVALCFDRGAPVILALLGMSVLSWTYYEFSPIWWPINTPEMQEKIHQLSGLSSYGAQVKIILVGILKSLILYMLIRGLFKRDSVSI